MSTRNNVKRRTSMVFKYIEYIRRTYFFSKCFNFLQKTYEHIKMKHEDINVNASVNVFSEISLLAKISFSQDELGVPTYCTN